MGTVLVFILGIILGFGVKAIVQRRQKGNFASKGKEELGELQESSREALGERTEGRKEKILYILNNEATHRAQLKACGVEDIRDGITSLNVEKLLDVSGATARKYLNELEHEGKIKQIGKAGRGVYYTLNP